VIVLAACGDDINEARDPLASDDAVAVELGGDTTREVTGRNSFGLPAPTLTNDERRAFEIGDSFFTQNWVTAPASTEARDGLGPVFNAQACSSCHLLDGRGIPGDTGSGEIGLLIRLSVPGDDGPEQEPNYGDQFQDRAIEDVPAEGDVVITYTEVEGQYADGTTYSLRRPTYSLENLNHGGLTDDVMMSPRLAPQVIGMGLLEAIPEDDIVARADPDDADGDGISGRPNFPWNPRTEQHELGRFGWKANAPTVEAQAAGAFNGDIGITSPLHPDQPCTDIQDECHAAPSGGEPELDESRLGSVTFYTRHLAVPAKRSGAGVADGEQLFTDFGCAACHTPTFTTAAVDTAALSEQTIHPFTDLLLHDMGEGLADERPDFDASGTEWKTPPLWGIGLIEDVNGERFLLHDGRARTIEEAILWHGGEAEPSMETFRTAAADDRSDLVAFLESL
jgi:CxxC motif-containing protein (DUF1111 family)